MTVQRSLRYFPAFQRDVTGTLAYLAQEAGRDIAIRFLERLEEGLSAIAHMPEAGQRYGFAHPKLQEIRRRRVPDFGRYIVFYQVKADSIDMLHLYHAARDIDLLFMAEIL